MARILEKLFGSYSQRELKKIQPILDKVLSYEEDYKKLSEGTKDTVSLAFRLAVLDHLFPQGGGVIVLDDPFTDMDAERTEQACALLQECAKQHQVIFLTCKEEYLDMLGGNHIMM